MQSYAPRQELGERQMPNTPASENEDHAEHGINEPNQAGHDTTGQPSFVFTGQGPRRRHRYWTHPESVSLLFLHSRSLLSDQDKASCITAERNLFRRCYKPSKSSK